VRHNGNFAMASMHYGDNQYYERAIKIHLRYADRHGYSTYVLREDIYNGVWNKIVYLMHAILNEMAKGTAGARWIM
jgi:hypothetical protein